MRASPPTARRSGVVRALTIALGALIVSACSSGPGVDASRTAVHDLAAMALPPEEREAVAADLRLSPFSGWFERAVASEGDDPSRRPAGGFTVVGTGELDDAELVLSTSVELFESASEAAFDAAAWLEPDVTMALGEAGFDSALSSEVDGRPWARLHATHAGDASIASVTLALGRIRAEAFVVASGESDPTQMALLLADHLEQRAREVASGTLDPEPLIFDPGRAPATATPVADALRLAAPFDTALRAALLEPSDLGPEARIEGESDFYPREGGLGVVREYRRGAVVGDQVVHAIFSIAVMHGDRYDAEVAFSERAGTIESNPAVEWVEWAASTWVSSRC